MGELGTRHVWPGSLDQVDNIRGFSLEYKIKTYGKMVDFGKSDKMIKISGKVDKPTHS